jgi:hypothetical protein
MQNPETQRHQEARHSDVTTKETGRVSTQMKAEEANKRESVHPGSYAFICGSFSSFFAILNSFCRVFASFAVQSVRLGVLVPLW